MSQLNRLLSMYRMTRRLVTLDATYENSSLSKLLTGLHPRTIKYSRDWGDAELIRKVSETLIYRLRGPAMGNCLKLAILRFEAMLAYGYNVTFHLGVRPAPEGLTGHAWLSLNGEPLWEDAQKLAGFRETFRYPAVELGREELLSA